MCALFRNTVPSLRWAPRPLDTGLIQRRATRRPVALALLLSGLLGLPGLAWAFEDGDSQSPITITTRVEPKNPRLGDLIDYQINVAYPKGYSVNLPARLELPPLRVISSEADAQASSGQGLFRRFHLTLQSFSIKNAKIPAFELTYVDAQAQVHTQKVPAHTLEMQALTVNEAEPERRGEDPMRSPLYPNEKAELAIWATLIGLVLGGALYALWRWRRSQPRAVPAPPPVPAHEAAHTQLTRLEGAMTQRFEEGAGVLVYLELTEIAKRYLGARFGVDCLDRTTDEIREALRRNPQVFHPIPSDELEAFLRNCDLIKFARVATQVDDATDELARVRTWVQISTPKASPAPSSEQDGALPPPQDGASPPPQDGASQPAQDGTDTEARA